jgi:predicted permease
MVCYGCKRLFFCKIAKTLRMLAEILWLFGIIAIAIALAWLLWFVLNFFLPQD